MSPSVESAPQDKGRLAPTDLERERERYLRYLTLERGRSKNTLSAYRADLGTYLEALAGTGITRPGDITPVAVADYVNGLPGTATTVARKLSSIRNFHRFLLEEAVISRDPGLEVPSPRLPSRLPKALTIEQVGALLDAVAGDDPIALRDRALLEFLYATGARVSEALALTVDDIVGDDSQTRETIRVTGKGQKQRIVPVGSYARKALDAYLTRARPALVAKAKKSTPHVFVGARGAGLSRQNAWLVMSKAAQKAQLIGLVSPHTLRHSFATHVLAGGADIRVVQELLGHSSVSTTQIYTKVTIDTLRDVYQSSHPRAR
jgi:integrase/recombinase XerD